MIEAPVLGDKNDSSFLCGLFCNQNPLPPTTTQLLHLSEKNRKIPVGGKAGVGNLTAETATRKTLIIPPLPVTQL